MTSHNVARGGGAVAREAGTRAYDSSDFWLYSPHFKTPYLAQMQGDTLMQFLKHDADVYFVSTDCSANALVALKMVSHKLNALQSGTGKRFHAISIPKVYSWIPSTRAVYSPHSSACNDEDPSRKEGMIYTWCVREHMLKQRKQPKYLGFLHGDMFLINPFDVRPYLDVRGIYGSKASYGDQHHFWHLHPQLMFMRTDQWQLAQAEFGPACMCGTKAAPGCCMDTGGGMLSAFNLSNWRKYNVPKHQFRMFKEFNLIGTPGVGQALPGPLSTFNEALEGVNHALLHDAFNPWTNENYVFGAQYEAYEYFGDAWVHSRHAKLLNMSVRGVQVQWTPTLQSSPWWAHPKNAYIKGLVDCRLWLICNTNDRRSVTMPSGAELSLDSYAIKKATDRLATLMGSPDRGYLQLLQPDNAYVKGCMDATMRFWGQTSSTQMRAEFGDPKTDEAADDWPVGVTTRPGGGPC